MLPHLSALAHVPASLLQIAWTAFMSHMASNSSQDKPAEQPAAARNSSSHGGKLQQAGRGM
jgi:hypothetical protein